LKIFYRPEIDGLRAIAVIAVVFYHAQIEIYDYQFFQGGFIGVDIFFVISGYLITSIILKELFISKNFSFKFFYERRIRRILPVLILVMLVSIIFAWKYMLPSSLINFSKSIIFSLGFISNFYFWFSGNQYDAVSSSTKPFLHTWSLSVEEQFYIFFPILIYFCFKYFKRNLIHILIFMFIASLVMADWGSKNFPLFSFYGLATRIWELLAGSILAYIEIVKGYRSNNKFLNFLSASIGFFLIIYSIFFFNHKIFHPSYFTLLPVFGTCLIIWYSNKEELVTKILSTKLITWIGLISYSLYLWHYPIFAFDKIIGFSSNILEREILIIIFLLIISFISYYFIERPFRSGLINFKILLSTIIFGSFLIFIFCLIVLNQNGFMNRTPKIIYNLLSKEFSNVLTDKNGNLCHNNINGCKFNISSNKKIYLIGDSHMEKLSFDLKNKLITNNYQFIVYTLDSCLFFPGFDLVNKKTKKVNKNCNNKYFQRIKQTLSKEKNSTIIFGGRLPLYLSDMYFNNQEGGVEENHFSNYYAANYKYKNIGNSFIEEVTKISKKNKIILIYPIPEAGWHIPSRIHIFSKKYPNMFNLNNIEIDNFITTSYAVFKRRTNLSFELLDSVMGQNIYRVYPHKLFCNNIFKNRCVTHDNKNIFYIDDDHVSFFGAEMINSLIFKQIKKKLN